MVVNKSNIKIAVTDLLALSVTILFWIGVRYLFPVCEPKGDTFMSCHWAGEMLKAVSWLLAALSVIHLFIPDLKTKAGIDLSFIGICALTLNIPGGIVRICSSPGMSCVAAVPWIVGFSVLLGLISLADILFCISRVSKEHHSRERRGETA